MFLNSKHKSKILNNLSHSLQALGARTWATIASIYKTSLTTAENKGLNCSILR